MIEVIILITLSANAIGLILLNNHLNNLDDYFTDITNLNKKNTKMLADYIVESEPNKIEQKETIKYTRGSLEYRMAIEEAINERICPDCHKMFKNSRGVAMHRGHMIARGDEKHAV